MKQLMKSRRSLIAVLLLSTFCPIVLYAAVWTDSTGLSVIDGAASDRTSRGTNLGSVIDTSIDMDNLTVMSNETAQAITDLADVLGDDGQAIATCTIPAKQATGLECPTYTGSSCQSMPSTGFKSLTASYTNTYDLWSWNSGYGSYGPSLTYRKTHVVSPIYYDDVPSLTDLGVTEQIVASKTKTIDIILDQSGYYMTINGEPATEDPIGDLSKLGNTRFTNLPGAGDELSPIIANFPMLTLPRYKFRYYTKNSPCGKGGCSYTTNDYESYTSNKYGNNRFFKVGFNNPYPAGKLVDMFSIYDIEHITSGGKYTNTIRLSVETAQIQNGSNYYTMFEGYKMNAALLEHWGDNNKGERDFDNFHAEYTYNPVSEVPVGSEISTPFRTIVTCTLQ